MKAIKVKPITTENFAAYGLYVNVLKPEGHSA